MIQRQEEQPGTIVTPNVQATLRGRVSMNVMNDHVNIENQLE